MDRPLLYIHGFASTGRSAKAGYLDAAFENVYAPTLTHIPALAVETLEQFTAALGRPLLVGSSLGGLYALYLSHRFGLPAVLVNPVTYLDVPLADVVGFNRSYFDGSRFEFTPDHLHSLSEYAVRQPNTSRLLLMVQMGDELLDHKRTLEYLSGAQVDIDPKGDHGFSGFQEKLPVIREFARSFEEPEIRA